MCKREEYAETSGVKVAQLEEACAVNNVVDRSSSSYFKLTKSLLN